MAKQIPMPQMGFDMTEGTIAAWLKKEGEAVTKGEPIAEIETDKTTIQIEAFQSGVLLKQLAQPGQKVPVGESIGVIGDEGESVAIPAAPSAPVAAPGAARATNGSAVPAPTVALSTPAAPAVVHTGRVIATPVAKRIAEERGVDLRLVTGTGPEGRITKSDVEGFAPSAAPAAKPADVLIPAPVAMPATPVVAPLQAAPPSAADTQIAAIATAAASSKPAAGARTSLSKMRQTIAKRMVESKTQVPHFYITQTVEMDAALALRGQINDSLKVEGIKISVNDMVVRAVALALKKFPAMNSSFAGDALGGAIEGHADVNVGIAVTVPGGLVTVTVRNADAKTLRQISQEAVGLAGRARDGKSQPGDFGGQTFTISNLGMYGVDEFIAIVNQPDAGILAVASAQQTPVVRDGQVVIRNIMKMTLSGDHRVVDGAVGAEFINEIKRLLESPWNLVL
jgi:pyruvate dehydrogenase E2 component (dihydrolipoamide acetyltransferase)